MHLWEKLGTWVGHPEPDVTIASWDRFEPGWGRDDSGRRLLVAWQWRAEDASGQGVLRLTFARLNMGLLADVHVNVTGADEDRIRAWLASRRDTQAVLWGGL